ncbi:MAG TPA: hypothetical protein VIM53_03380 [Candidatus Saccharimonadales bacterium]
MTAELIHPQAVQVPEQIFAEADPTRRALEQLRHSMWYNADRPEVVRDTFEATRTLGDEFLTSAAGSRGREMAEDLSRAWAVLPKQHFTEGRIENGAVAHFGGSEGLKMDDENVLFEAGNLDADMRAAGIQPRHPKDAELIIRVFHGSHEMGHMLDKGLSVSAVGDAFGEFGLGTFGYVAMHPEKGMVADFRISARAHAERFAQGMAVGVTARALRSLGYDRREVKKVIAMKAARLDMSGEEGANQLDYVDDPNAIGALKAASKSGKKLAAVHDNYGVLGYQLPSTPGEMASEVLEMSAMPRVTSVNRQEWAAQQQASRTRGNEANLHIRKLQRQRQESLHGQSPERGGRFRKIAHSIGSLVMSRSRR